MKVVIIGSGNTATVMGGRIASAGHTILQVMARRDAAAAALAGEWGSAYTTQWAGILRTADLYIFALSDTALTGVGPALQLPEKLVVHTSGAVAAGVLKSVSDRYGVLYPLQSLRKEMRPFPEFPLLIDAGDPADLSLLETFAGSIARQVQRADDSQRLKLHTAAVVVNNFSNYLYTLAADFCRQEGVDFSLLLPLILETAQRLERYPPQEAQTGPAIRGDAGTMDRHLDILKNYDNIKELYGVFSAQIEAYYHTR